MTERSKVASQLLSLGRSVVAVIIGVVFTLLLLLVLSDQPDNQELYDRQEIVLEQLQYVGCLLLIPPSERIPENIAACVVESGEGENG